MTKTISLSAADAVRVHAILMTHAEMQDSRAVQSTELLGRLKRDEPGELAIIDELQGQVDTFEGDCDNLRRIADLFIT
jgi:hypothetical protein